MSKKDPKPRNDVVISPRTGRPMKKPSGKSIRLQVESLPPGENSKNAEVNLRLFNLPEIDINDPEAVTQRLGEYFQIYADADMKPTVAGMAIALGRDREWLLWAVHDRVSGNGYGARIDPSSLAIVKKAYSMMENFWENNMNSGKLNPVTGIFLAKNNFGYRDQTETILTPNVQEQAQPDLAAIQERYSQLPDDETPDNDSDEKPST